MCDGPSGCGTPNTPRSTSFSVRGATSGSEAAELSRKWGLAHKPPTPPSFPRGRRAHLGSEGAGRGSGSGVRVLPPAQRPRGARPAPGGGVRGLRGPPLPLWGRPRSPPAAQSPKPTFDAGHGGDVAPASETRGDGGGGGGGRETGDARRRPDNTRKCAMQHFRRRLALALGRGGRAGLGAFGLTPSSPALLPWHRRPARLRASAPVPGPWRLQLPCSLQCRGSSIPQPPTRIPQPPHPSGRERESTRSFGRPVFALNRQEGGPRPRPQPLRPALGSALNGGTPRSTPPAAALGSWGGDSSDHSSSPKRCCCSNVRLAHGRSLR
ncbi:hypothetical protein J1605_010224 [Eschrichtius robustus]|uniref:Uncharacterized protein n=1 Tax=Eschrichtius robustus TaxID=9764 RepID=A0AB34GUE7_ESCRO|nr:hypothetical protein J1605_010224 [Eschrichtius robustus]